MSTNWIMPLLRRVLQLVLVVVGIAVINFFLLRLAPGDVVSVIAGESGSATPEVLDRLREEFGLNEPVWMQLGRYVMNLATFNLGYSFRQNAPVLDIILSRLWPTVLLMSASISFAVIVGSYMGFIAARFAGKVVDTLVSAAALLFYAIPVFWAGVMMIIVFSVMLDWLPVGGMATIGSDLSGFGYVIDVARHMVLPTVTLGLFYIAVYTRLVRTTMINIYQQDFVRTAVAKGVRSRRIASRHVMRNALLPVVTMIGVQIGSIFGGAVLVETVFSWPGLGRLAFEALFQRDLNLLMGILFCSSVLVVIVNLLVDVAYAMLDPRVEFA